MKHFESTRTHGPLSASRVVRIIGFYCFLGLGAQTLACNVSSARHPSRPADHKRDGAPPRPDLS